MDNVYIIYLVKSPTNRYYVGITSTSFEVRKKSHFQEATYKSQKTYNNSFKKAIRKYGDLLEWTILEESLTENEAKQKEIYYIKYYNTFYRGYNMTIGGDGRGSYSKEFIKDDAKRYNTVFEWKKNNRPTYDSACRFGKEFLNECKPHMKRKKRANTFTKDQLIQKASIYKSFKDWRSKDRSSYQIAKKHGTEFLKKCIPTDNLYNKLICLKDGKIIGEFSTILECAQFLDVDPGNLSRALSIKNNFKEFVFKWL